MASAILNLAEGNSRTTGKERRHFFGIALGSISEVAAIMDVASALSYSSTRECEKIKDELRCAYAMIRKLQTNSG